jgi:hypothetical protein
LIYEIDVNYDEDILAASFDCPFCQQNWLFPFHINQTSGELWPLPHDIVMRHLMGDSNGSDACPSVPSPDLSIITMIGPTRVSVTFGESK